jgi:cytochrome c-type biogenesis protein
LGPLAHCISSLHISFNDTERPMALDVTYPAAFLAGLLSFLSPCVLPLVPPYLCYLAGATLDELTGESPAPAIARRAVIGSLLFVAGFTSVFVLLGAAASALGHILRVYQNLLATLAGVAIILMGLHFLGVFRLALLYREARLQGPREPLGLLTAYPMGLAFAFGWTPCIGPVLAAVLAVAATEDTLARGMSLLAVYSLGIGVPFTAAAIGIRPFLGFLGRFRRHLGRVEQTMGGLLVMTGVLFLTGWMTTFSYWLLETFPVLARLG